MENVDPLCALAKKPALIRFTIVVLDLPVSEELFDEMRSEKYFSRCCY